MYRSSDKKTATVNRGLLTAARGGGLGLVGMISSRLLSLLLQVTIARHFGITFFGSFITGFMLCGILQVFASIGLPIGGVYFMVRAIENESGHDMLRIYWTCVLEPIFLGSILGIVFYMSAPFISCHIFSKPDLLPVFQLFAFAIPWLSLLRVLAELSRSFGTVRYTVILEDILFPFIQICLVLFYCTGKANSQLVILSFLISAIICAVLMCLVVHRQIRNHLILHTKYSSLKAGVTTRSILSYSIPLVPTGVIFMINNNIDIFMLNMLGNGGEVGIYAAATRWTLLVDSVGVPILAIFRPLIAKAISCGEAIILLSLVRASIRWMFYIVLPFIGALLIASQPAMDFFLKVTAPKTALILLWILLIARITNPIGNVSGLVLTMGGQQYKELFSIAFGGILSALLNVLLIPKYGIIGAAIATGVGYYSTTLWRIYFIWRIWRIVPLGKRMIPPLSALLIIMMLNLFFNSGISPVLQLIGGGVAALFVVCSNVFWGWEQEDKDIARQLPRFVGNIMCRVQSVVDTLISKVNP